MISPKSPAFDEAALNESVSGTPTNGGETNDSFFTQSRRFSSSPPNRIQRRYLACISPDLRLTRSNKPKLGREALIQIMQTRRRGEIGFVLSPLTGDGSIRNHIFGDCMPDRATRWPRKDSRAPRRIRDPSSIFDENLFKCDQPHTALADSRTSLTVGLHPKSRCTQASRRRLTWSILAYIHQ